VAGLTVALVPLAERSAPVGLYLRLGTGMLCYQFAIGLTNDLADAARDAVTKPRKPIAAGDLPRMVAAGFALAFVSGGAAATAGLGMGAWLIGVAGLGCGLLYNAWLKRTAWSWLPLAVALPLIPSWVWVSAGAWDGSLWWSFPLGLMLGLALHLANQAPDVAAELALEVRGLAHRLGERTARLVATALFVAAGALAAVVASRHSLSAAGVIVAIAAVGAAVAPLAPRFLGRDGQFGLLAVASAALALVFLAANQS
jgi:4-hydroxybenzoate polyprenyltransferase